MSVPAAKTERLSCRITPASKRLLEHVAARHGMSTSDYVINQAIDNASRELLDEIVIRIPADKWESLLADLDADREPNAKLVEAARAFTKGTFTGDVYHAPD